MAKFYPNSDMIKTLYELRKHLTLVCNSTTCSNCQFQKNCKSCNIIDNISGLIRTLEKTFDNEIKNDNKEKDFTPLMLNLMKTASLEKKEAEVIKELREKALNNDYFMQTCSHLTMKYCNRSLNKRIQLLNEEVWKYITSECKFVYARKEELEDSISNVRKLAINVGEKLRVNKNKWYNFEDEFTSFLCHLYRVEDRTYDNHKYDEMKDPSRIISKNSTVIGINPYSNNNHNTAKNSDQNNKNDFLSGENTYHKP